MYTGANLSWKLYELRSAVFLCPFAFGLRFVFTTCTADTCSLTCPFVVGVYVWCMHGGFIFAQVENKYDTQSLSEWHKNALESCILDCVQGGLIGSR